MRPAVFFLGALVGLLAAQGTRSDCPHKKSATLLPSFTVTPTATESTGSPGTTSHSTTTAETTSHAPNTTTHQAPTTPGHRNTTIHPTTSNSTSNTTGTTGTGKPHTSTSYTQPGPGPRPPPPSPGPGPQDAIGDYTWTTGSQPCARLQARIQIGVVYPTQAGGQAWGISVLNPNSTKPWGDCDGARPHLLLSFPFGQLSFGFTQEPQQGSVYLDYLALQYNVSFPQAARESPALGSLALNVRAPERGSKSGWRGQGSRADPSSLFQSGHSQVRTHPSELSKPPWARASAAEMQASFLRQLCALTCST